MRKVFKWVGIVLLSPVVLFILLALLLYIPPLQNYVVKKVTVYASRQTGMYIHIDRVKLAFPLDLAVDGVEVVSQQDTILLVDRIQVDVQLLPLLQKKVEINGISLENAKVNTSDLISTMRLNGSLDEFYLSSHGIELTSEMAVLNEARLKNANLHICLKDTVVEKDTVSSPVYWKFELQKIALQNVTLALQLNDTTSLSTSIGDADLRNGFVDLKKNAYRAGKFVLQNGTFTYDADTLAAQRGWDASHIALEGIEIELDSVTYAGRDIAFSIPRLEAKERSGLHLISLKGRVTSDKKAVRIPVFSIQTSDSFIDFKADMEWDALEPNRDGLFTARFLAELGKHDLMTFMGKMPELFVKEYPNAPIMLRAGMDGNINNLRITGIQTQLEGAFRASMQGEITNVLDSVRRTGALTIKSETQDLTFITALVDSANSGSYVIPQGMDLNGKVGIKGDQYSADLNLKENTGLISLLASYNGRDESYEAKIQIDSLHVHDFMPKDSIYYLSAKLSAKGAGFDFYAPDTYMEADAVLDTLQYGNLNLSGVTLQAGLHKGQAQVTLDSDNPLLRMNSRLDGYLSREEVSGRLLMDIKEADLYQMRLVDSPLKTSVAFALEAKSDWRKLIALKGGFEKIKVITSKNTYLPKNLYFNASTSKDSTYMSVNAGDFKMKLEGRKDIETIIKNLTDFSTVFVQQAENKHLELDALKTYLPELCAQISSGTDNPINNYLMLKGFRYNRLFMDLDTSPIEGINGTSYLYALRMDSLCLDTLRFDIHQDTSGVKFFAEVKNAPTNKQFVFDATLDGQIHEKGARLKLKYLDEKQRTGVLLGLGVDLVDHGLQCYFFPEHPIIAYQPFNLNEGNYIYFRKDGHIEGKVNLLNDKGTGVRFYSTPNEEVFQDLTFELCRIDIGELLQVIPYMPDITGILNSEIHYQKSGEQMSLVAETSLDSLSYEKSLIGNISNSTIYLPKDQVTHYVDTRFAKDRDDIFVLRGDYKDLEEGILDMDMTLEHFPLNMVNGFIPDRLVSLEGDLDGSLEVKGTTASPVVNGELILDSVFMNSEIYGVRFRFDNRPVAVTNSHLLFDRFNIYTRGKTPFTIDGDVDFATLSRIGLDLRMHASDYELVNAPRRKTSVVYGKVYVDFFSTVRGALDNLVVRGNMTVQGKTDVTYVLKDSPLTVDDRLGDLVTFVNFNDTTKLEEAEDKKYTLGGIDLLMNVQIDQGAEMRVDLSADHESYVELRGGGNLSLQYTPQGDLLLSGRYTLTSGEMKYELPVIPLKTFNIKNGSFVEFTGNPMNPYMNISATERIRSTVTENNSPRTVSFDVGISITNTLENMGLEFTLEAPEDMTVQNQLAAMSKEERGKLAVAMLATGMYLGSDGGSGGFNANSALNSFLQSEISNIAGSALKTVDISVGMEDATSADGTSRTDYSFRFAKRFWNNRLSVVIGGRISSGNDVAEANSDDSFIDDVSLEWRLDDSGTRYIRLFHNKDYESILEGEITETGVGIVLRRKMTKLGELFIFKKKKNRTMNREVTPKP